ncbi:MAG: hypothetical protein AVDCRST_MAG19-2087, partial [uncultured Thermomicrobiales bacterium]
WLSDRAAHSLLRRSSSGPRRRSCSSGDRTAAESSPSPSPLPRGPGWGTYGTDPRSGVDRG